MSLNEPILGTFARGSVWLMLLILLTNLDGSWASPTYDPDNPPYFENFDPAEADPKANITCIGDSYDLELPTQAHFNPNAVSMQKLCAKPQYGGGPPGQHVGGWCAFRPYPLTIFHSRFEGSIAFDLSPSAQVNIQLATPRVLLGCYYRCFCNYGLHDTSVQPITTKTNHNTMSHATYQVKIDVVDDFVTPKAQHMGTLGSVDVRNTFVSMLNQVEAQLEQAQYLASLRVSIDPENYITCRGNLPTFSVPAPYQTSDFSSLQELCAVQMSGGN